MILPVFSLKLILNFYECNLYCKLLSIKIGNPQFEIIEHRVSSINLFYVKRIRSEETSNFNRILQAMLSLHRDMPRFRVWKICIRRNYRIAWYG